MIQNCLREMFIWWINNGEVTAEKLADAIHAVGEHGLEQKIYEKFGKQQQKTHIFVLPSLTIP